MKYIKNKQIQSSKGQPQGIAPTDFSDSRRGAPCGYPKFGFTLVELIVVISIIAILGTIAFISFGGYSSTARDSVRIEELSNIDKGLQMYQIKNSTQPD